MASRRRESEDDDEDFPGLCWEAKRQKQERTSSQRCIICLEVGGEILRKGKALATFISALRRRKDDVYFQERWKILRRLMYFDTRHTMLLIQASRTFGTPQSLTIRK